MLQSNSRCCACACTCISSYKGKPNVQIGAAHFPSPAGTMCEPATTVCTKVAQLPVARATKECIICESVFTSQHVFIYDYSPHNLMQNHNLELCMECGYERITGTCWVMAGKKWTELEPTSTKAKSKVSPAPTKGSRYLPTEVHQLVAPHAASTALEF